MDYQSNSRKSKDETKDGKTIEEKPEIIEKVISGDAAVKKRTLGDKLKDTFFGGDAQSVGRYIAAEVLLPAFRNLMVDATTKGVERMVYGEDRGPRRHPQNYGPRTTYNTPVSRAYDRDPRYSGRNLPDQPTYLTPRPRSGNEIILSTRDESELVLEAMQDILDKYDVVSMSDLRMLVGIPTTHTDNKWGWYSLRGTSIRQNRGGYLLDLPPAEPL